MKNKLVKDSSGIAHLGLIIIIVLVVGVVGFGTYRVIDANKSQETAELTDQDVENFMDDEENNAQKEVDDNSPDVSKAEQEAKNEVN